MKMSQFKLGQHVRDWNVRPDKDNALHVILKTPEGEISRPYEAVNKFIETEGSIDVEQFKALQKKK